MALTCDLHPPHHIPLLIGCEQAPPWLMSSVQMYPGGNFVFIHGKVGRREKLPGVPSACHTRQLACLRAPSSWPCGHTVQRRSGRNAWNWAVGWFKSQRPKSIGSGEESLGPQTRKQHCTVAGSVGQGLGEWGALSLRVELRDRMPPQEQSCMCTGAQCRH